MRDVQTEREKHREREEGIRGRLGAVVLRGYPLLHIGHPSGQVQLIAIQLDDGLNATTTPTRHGNRPYNIHPSPWSFVPALKWTVRYVESVLIGKVISIVVIIIIINF